MLAKAGGLEGFRMQDDCPADMCAPLRFLFSGGQSAGLNLWTSAPTVSKPKLWKHCEQPLQSARDRCISSSEPAPKSDLL